MDNARYDAGELRNNSQGAERAAQIGAMERIAAELFDKGALQANKNATDRDLHGAVEEGNPGGEPKSNLHGEVGEDNPGGEPKSNFTDRDLHGAVGEGNQGGELKNNFNDRNSQVQGDRENGRDSKAGNATWPKTFRDNDARLPQHLDFSNPYPTSIA